MEVFLGAIVTFTIILAANLTIRKPMSKLAGTKIRYTQSHVYSLMAPILRYVPDDMVERKPTQSGDYRQSSYVRVIILDDYAYWIKDQALYVAEIVDGFVNKETTRRVDTMTMDKVELDKTMFIVEKLREGLDDEDSGTGK